MFVQSINIDIPLMPNILFVIQDTPVSPKSLLRVDDYKSQEQTLKIAEVELRQGCFSHGQFYMACLHCKLTTKPGYFATIFQKG